MNIYFFPNGNTAVFNEEGEQVPALQESWILLYVKHLEAAGIDPTQCEVMMPDGYRARIFRTEEGYNWETVWPGSGRATVD
jgi:hypothetical protein